MERYPDGAEPGRYGLYHGSLWTGIQGYVAAVEGVVQAPDGREHRPWRQSRPQMDGRQCCHAAGPGGKHQAG